MRNTAKPPTATSSACDCGRPRDPRSPSCPACAWLDGASDSEALVIAALRTHGGCCTREALADETGMPARTLRRTLAKLRRLGRLVAATDGERATYALRMS